MKSKLAGRASVPDGCAHAPLPCRGSGHLLLTIRANAFNRTRQEHQQNTPAYRYAENSHPEVCWQSPSKSCGEKIPPTSFAALSHAQLCTLELSRPSTSPFRSTLLASPRLRSRALLRCAETRVVCRFMKATADSVVGVSLPSSEWASPLRSNTNTPHQLLRSEDIQ